ncbi:MAG: cytochrome P450 [Actinomycetota bacterium]
MTASTDLDIFSNNERWSDVDDWNRAALRLHDRGGIHRIEREGFPPFWAVIDHRAVLDVERQPAVFRNGPEPVLRTTEQIVGRQAPVKSLIHMDAPEHGAYRKVIADWFKPRTVAGLGPTLDELSRRAVDKMAAAGSEIDFATAVALPYPLEVILTILGLPEADYPHMLTLTQELFGGEDPDMQRAKPTPETRAAILADFSRYFAKLTAARRANPTDDLASAIANATIDGERLPDLQTVGLYLIVATAGHDTTSSAMAGGLRALIEHPDQLTLLKEDTAGRMQNAVEEMLRWTAPVRHFMRTAHEETEILGQEIGRGEWIYLSYKAANLDPKVFDDPLGFDIERPNADRHASFGHGVHFCLGAQLARLEMRSLFSHLVSHIDAVELAASPTTMKTTFVGGHKSLPIGYELVRES